MATEAHTPPNPAICGQDLTSRVAIITGASRGLGRTIAFKLASRGCSILGTCSSRETLHHLDTLADEIAASHQSSSSTTPPPKVVGIVGDVYSPTCAEHIADALEKHFSSGVDIFISNAAPRSMARVGALNAEHIQTFNTGIIQTPALIVDELVKRKMFKRNSRILHISSVRSKKVDFRTPMYCATKAATEALVRCWADAFGGKNPEFEFMAGTTANTVLVGLTRTEPVKELPQHLLDWVLKEWEPLWSMPKMAEPEDVADIVGLLCSHEARWITGSVVSADGGGMKIL
ncbi:uncharacterized protein LTR77_009356 [Saxophila tyrrhenica]|uniref:3-oxoacyl-[acyl-carrier-protein] reductase n=1 Tax=Saxophila tyrrhenica TaxID=1690608 RepID=A0AAV9P2Z3_9PEZI|nr:hypothetical protein LTR77_009356 [Saxophila tyrrhenica]